MKPDMRIHVATIGDFVAYDSSTSQNVCTAFLGKMEANSISEKSLGSGERRFPPAVCVRVAFASLDVTVCFLLSVLCDVQNDMMGSQVSQLLQRLTCKLTACGSHSVWIQFKDKGLGTWS